MKKLIFALVMMISFVFANLAYAATQTPQWIKNLPAASAASQLIVIAQVGEKNTAWISMHEKVSGSWQQIMTTPAFIGRNGLGKTREGDGKTPVGTFRFTAAFGIAADPGCSIPYTQVYENIYWSYDVNCRYNEMVDIRNYPRLDKASSEHLIDYNPQYAYALNISYNETGAAGKGSAIFMQCLDPTKPWTSGGIAIPVDKMLFVMHNVRPDCAIVIDSLENLGGEL